MSYDDFLAADQFDTDRPRNDDEKAAAKRRETKARVTISVYTRRQGLPEPQRIDLYRQLVDELGLNGRPMATSRHYRKNNPKWVGEL